MYGKYNLDSDKEGSSWDGAFDEAYEAYEQENSKFA